MNTNDILNNEDVFSWIRTSQLTIVREKSLSVYLGGKLHEIQTTLFSLSRKRLVLEQTLGSYALFFTSNLASR